MSSFHRDRPNASSITLRRTLHRANNGSSPLPLRPTRMTESPSYARPRRHFVIGVDYGTTNTSASFFVRPAAEFSKPDFPERAVPIAREEIKHITNYGNDPFRTPFVAAFLPNNPGNDQVPSEVWYPDDAIRSANPFSQDTQNGYGTDSRSEDRSSNGEEEISSSESAPEKRHTYWRDAPADIHWGYDSQAATGFSNVSQFLNPRNSPIKWAKLQLALKTSKHREGYPESTRKSFYALRRHGVVGQELDLITDFLICFFKHIKTELEVGYDLQDTDSVEMVLCVPVCWDCRARQLMQSAFHVAMKSSGLGSRNPGQADDLFILTEPEAAAAYVLDEQFDVMRGTTFILIDAGGGTVDVITYKVTNTDPLRLEKEQIPEDGDLCGSTFLNKDFRAFVKEKLSTASFSDNTGESSVTLDHIIDERIMKDFENKAKRFMDFNNASASQYLFDVPNLIEDRSKGFFTWNMLVTKDEFRKIFEPRMDQVATLMIKQLKRCREKNIDVMKVVLIGGYGDNKALQSHLRLTLERLAQGHGSTIDLKCASKYGMFATAVSTGAVLRALNKEDGPSRKLLSSWGLQRRELVDKSFEGHRKGKRTWSQLDGCYYIRDTILWQFIKDEEVIAQPPPKVLATEHTFPLEGNCIVKEIFYVSDTLKESHWQLNSSKNKGKWQVVGTFTLDLTEWRERGLMELQTPGGNERGQTRWAVKFDIVMELIGRSIRCSARHPSSGEENGQATGKEIQNSRVQFCIAAAFEPGTA